MFMLMPLRKSDASKVTLMATVKDGQLCWGAVSFSAAAMYELHSETALMPGIARALSGWVTGGLVLILGMAAMAAAGGAIFTTELRRARGMA